MTSQAAEHTGIKFSSENPEGIKAFQPQRRETKIFSKDFEMGKRNNFELLQIQRQRREELKQLKAELEKTKEKSRLRRKQKLEQKKEAEKKNQEKSSSYQVIKNNAKIRKWSKKAKEHLMKMPKELFEQYLNSTK
jgi:hypothetical protein